MSKLTVGEAAELLDLAREWASCAEVAAHDLSSIFDRSRREAAQKEFEATLDYLTEPA